MAFAEHRMRGCCKKESAARELQTARSMRTEHICCWLGVVLGLSLIAALVAVILMRESTEEVTILRQVHVFMSHGERTPSERELAMLGVAPERGTFAPYGTGALTNEGKLLTYEMGALLRRRYEEFLGEYYLPDEVRMSCSDTEISKMSALLVSAGLWPPPPQQLWNESLSWQPVPYTYPPTHTDYLLYEENCPRYIQEKQRILREFVKAGLLQPYLELFHKISQWTSTNFTTPAHAFHLSNLFLIQDDIKVANPKWAKHVKRKLMDAARLEYLMMFYNNLLRKLSGGAMLQHIISSAQAWAVAEHASPRARLHVYTGTPGSVAALLGVSAAPPPRLPDPGAALLLELHEVVARDARGAADQPVKPAPPSVPSRKRYGFKIFYWDDDSAEPRLMEVPGCSTFCPLETFIDLTKYIVSKDYHKDCREVPPPSGDHSTLI